MPQNLKQIVAEDDLHPLQKCYTNSLAKCFLLARWGDGKTYKVIPL